VSITERFQIDGKQISEEKLNTLYISILEQSKLWDIQLSFFEIQVISAVIYFLEEKVDHAVIEVGM